jgi:signal transduction histidine kinase
MHQSKLFNLTRWRLTSWYAGVMGVILSLCGVAFYQMMAQAHWQTLHQELESVAGTLHDGLEPVLRQPGHMEPRVEQLLPGLCLQPANCPEQSDTSDRHILGAVQQEGYYVRFLDQSGRMVATVGHQPEGLPFRGGTELWQTLQDLDGDRYHQISLLLKTENHRPWGYMQVGRSLREFDNHLANTRFVLLLGLPMAMLLVSGASWWLAGLVMQPVYQSYQQIQQFTADAAHELRTPLAASRATVESVLEMDDLSVSEARSTLKAVERQNSRLSQLVQDLLLLSRMDLRVLTSKHQSCCLNTLIRDLVDEFEAMAISADISLKTDVRVAQPLYVLGDEEQLYRLVANLTTNAIQYTPRGGKVTVILNREDTYALIQVQDTGIGIAPEEQSRIFERFYRVSSDRSRQTGGAGLGLPIARAIAQVHHGSLQVQSQQGKGSTFTVRLPLYEKWSASVS